MQYYLPITNFSVFKWSNRVLFTVVAWNRSHKATSECRERAKPFWSMNLGLYCQPPSYNDA